MAKVTSKLQLTVPKAIADQYGIRPGDELFLDYALVIDGDDPAIYPCACRGQDTS